MPHSAATVRLAPIIKTNHAQALALDMHMIQQLHHDAQQEEQQQQQAVGGVTVEQHLAAQQVSGQASKQPFRPLNSGQSVNTAYSSPQLSHRSALTSSSPAMARRTSTDANSQQYSSALSPSPLASSRALQAHLGQHHTLLYTFPNPPPINEESDAHTQQTAMVDSGSPRYADSSEPWPHSALPASLPLHVAVSSSAMSDGGGADALLSPGPLQPSSSCSSLSVVQSPHSSQPHQHLHSPVSAHSPHFTPPSTSPLLSPTDPAIARAAHTANASTANINGMIADTITGTATTASEATLSGELLAHSGEAGKSLSFADTYSAEKSVNGGAATGLSVDAPLLYAASSSPTASTSLSAPLVVAVGGLSARKQCKISESTPAGQSLLRRCLPCLPESSTSAVSASNAAAVRSAAAYRRLSRQKRQSRLRRASGDDGCCSNLVTCNPFRLSFRFTLVLLCILQVVVSVGIVWYLGYSNSESLIGTLSSQLRETALVEITGQIHDQMVRPMRAVNQLQYSYGRSLPNLSDLTTGAPNVSGLFADLSFVVFNYPEISGAGCSTRHNVFIAAINISAYLAAGASPKATNGITSGFAYAFQNYNDTVAVYHYPPVPSPNTDPNRPVPDYNASSTVADLGSVWYSVKGFMPNQRPQYVTAVAAKGAFAWSPVYQLAQATNSTVSVQQNQSLIAASKAYLTSDGSVGYVCFASVFLSRLGDLLRSLSVSYGANGLALITDRHGVPLASSDNNLMLYTGKRPTWSLCQFPDDRLQSIAAPLADNGVFFPANYTLPASPTGDFQFGGVFYQNEPAFPAVPINYGGSAYHLQATVLNSTGLDWVIVVVTKDTDFDGDISHHELVVGQYQQLATLHNTTHRTRDTAAPTLCSTALHSVHFVRMHIRYSAFAATTHIYARTQLTPRLKQHQPAGR